jgi:hypothetical protein
MLDHALESAFLALFQSDGAFTSLHFFTGHDDEQHKLPALSASAKSDPLAGSASVFRGELTLAVESEANDTTPEQHAARVEALRAKLADKAALIAAINAAGQIHLYGYALTATDSGVEATNFRTPVTLKVGYGAP